MSLLLAEDKLRARAAVAAKELAPLADGLTTELAPLLAGELYIPREKALLSREGGRCPRDGSTLEFDPFSPRRHRCPTCGEHYTGAAHDRFWVFWYQLWLAERAVHGALLWRLRCDASARTLATRILERYSGVYLRYANRDNVLGPTRLFFSTYLESIWLLNICIALDLLEGDESESKSLGARVREKIIEPSAAIIGVYDEGASNRQVWNDIALFAAGRLLDREELADRALHGRSGINYHLLNGLLADGTWYEGENYHLFAHRGLWYGVTMAQAAHATLSREGLDRFQEGFATPFLTALPDMTLPSRRDSQYAVSLRQPRFAELCELGLARLAGDGDRRLRAVLHRLYENDVARRDTGRARTTADVERNFGASALSRADLGWRSLLFARPELPRLDAAPLGTVLLEAQGLAVFRRERERIYVALDYGSSGGGHGHPDRLNMLLYDGPTRWLDDMGTGSYVDPSLQWYRSSLAHNAPMFQGCDQDRVDGELLAFDERETTGWVSARAANLYPSVTATRTLVVTNDYVIDEVRWQSDIQVALQLPFHIDAEVVVSGSAPPLAPFPDPDEYLQGPSRMVHDFSHRVVDALTTVRLTAYDGDRKLDGFVITSLPANLYKAKAPGPPGAGERRFLILRVAPFGERWVRTVWSWNDAVESVSIDRDAHVTTIARRHGSRDHHRSSGSAWQIEHVDERGKTTVEELGGIVTHARESSPPPRRPAWLGVPQRHLKFGQPEVFDLAADQYRRSEESWDEAGQPRARVAITVVPDELQIDIAVQKPGPLTFAPRDAVNHYDNESPDINGDGVQMYLDDAELSSGWVIVPELGSVEYGATRARVIEGWTPRRLDARWTRTPTGYSVHLRMPLHFASESDRSFQLGLVVNEMPPDRERRRGQLVLGGRPGEFVYLRGDREDKDHLRRFSVVD